MEDAPVVDAEVVDENEQQHDAPPPPQSQELIVASRPQGSTALIEAKTASEKREIAAEIATTLDDVIRQQGLRTKMGRRKKVDAQGNETWVDSFHVNVEGWQTLATFLDLAVVPVWTRQVIDPETGRPRRVKYPVKKTTRRDSGKTQIVEEYEVDGYDWEARVEVYKDGSLIAAAEAMVSRSEDSWKTRDDHALRSMAQTRATGKAIAGAARWIVALAGYSATPAEEMPAPAGDAEPEINFGPAIANGKRALAFEAIVELVRASAEPAGSDGELREAAKSVAGQIGGIFGGNLPALVGEALLLLANAHTARESAVRDREAQDQAAESGDLAQAFRAGDDASPEFPAGTVFIEGEETAKGGVDPARARFVTAAAAARMCQCKAGFDVVEAARAEGRDAVQKLGDSISDQCPIRNHGIPF